MFYEIVMGLMLALGGFAVFGPGFLLGLVAGFFVFRLYYAKEIAIAKQLYAAGYTKIEQIAAFIRKIA